MIPTSLIPALTVSLSPLLQAYIKTFLKKTTCKLLSAHCSDWVFICILSPTSETQSISSFWGIWSRGEGCLCICRCLLNIFDSTLYSKQQRTSAAPHGDSLWQQLLTVSECVNKACVFSEVMVGSCLQWSLHCAPSPLQKGAAWREMRKWGNRSIWKVHLWYEMCSIKHYLFTQYH